MADQRLFTILLVGILWGCVLGLQRPAPRYSQQLMPDTSFTCRHKIVGSYYADPETDCQLFHVCVSVAGSIQDYRFLCPNDTAFDQESQTCADWYDVDCEAATLYYASDNFDLYRLGSGLESLHYDSVRNDVEPLDHLQRSESSDPVRSAANNLNNNKNNNNNNGDILRGSSSSNFFNNRNNGKEIDDYDNDGKVYRNEKTPVQEPRRKQGVRKVARKQQFDSNNNNNNVVPTTGRPAVTQESNFGNNQNRNNNYQNNGYNQQRQNTNNFAASSTTVRPYVEQNNNNFVRNNNQNNNNQRYTAPPSTYRPTTVGNTYQQNNNNNNNNNGFNNQQNFNGFNSNKFPTTFAQSAVSSTARPIDYNTNVANKKKAPEQSFTNQFNQFSTQSTTPRASSTGYQATDYTGYQKNYNTVQRTTKSEVTVATTPATNFYDEYAVAAARLNDAQNINKVSAQTRQQEYSSQTTPRFSNNFAGSSYIPTTYSPVTKKVNNVNQGQTVNRGNEYSTGQYEATRTTNSGQYRGEKVGNNQQQQNSQVYRNTQSFDTTRSANLNNNENNGQYREVQTTRAPKKATQYNNYETKFNFNDASSTKSFDNFDQGKTAAVAGFSPASVNKLAESPVTLRPTTPVARRPSYNSPSTQRPSSSATNFAPQTTPGSRPGTGSFVSVTPGPFSSTVRPAERQAPTTAKPKTGKKNDYDYAYYDNAGALEYDGIDLEQVSGLRDSERITRN